MKGFLLALCLTVLPIALCGLVELYAVDAWLWLAEAAAELFRSFLHTAIQIAYLIA